MLKNIYLIKLIEYAPIVLATVFINGADLFPIVYLTSILVGQLASIAVQKDTKKFGAIKTWFRHNKLWFFLWCVMGVSSAYLLLTLQQPKLLFAKDVFNWVGLLGQIVVIIGPMHRVFSSIRKLKEVPHQMDLIQSYMTGMLAYSIIVSIIGHYGDAIYTFVAQHPHITEIAVVVCGLLWFVFKMGAAGEQIKPSTDYGVASAPSFKLTKQEESFVAAHEIGHALVYAALGQIPDYVEVGLSNGDDGVLGFVMNLAPEHSNRTKEYQEWDMLALLAGQYAEMRYGGSSTLGSAADHDKWLRLAIRYLQEQYRGLYFIVASTEFEAKHNVGMLEDLRDDQLRMLVGFFNENDDLHKEMTNHLITYKKIDNQSLIGFLKGARVPQDFPRPLGDFKRFSDQWVQPEMVS